MLRPDPDWTDWFDELVRQGRAATAAVGDGTLWLAAESLPLVEGLFPGAPVAPPDLAARRAGPARAAGRRERRAAAVRGHMATLGPADAEELARATALSTPAA